MNRENWFFIVLLGLIMAFIIAITLIHYFKDPCIKDCGLHLYPVREMTKNCIESGGNTGSDGRNCKDYACDFYCGLEKIK